MTVCQEDLVYTQWSFITPIITFHYNIGIKFAREEMEGFIHFWRVAGFYLGIKDRLVKIWDLIRVS